MKLLRQLCIILIICFLGQLTQKSINLPIPGSVLGMVILLICLSTGIIKLEMIEEVSNFLLDHIAFFFIPAGASLISYFGILKINLVAIVLISFISAIIIMAITGTVVQILKRR